MKARLTLALVLALGLAAPAPAVDMDAAQLHAATRRSVTLTDLGLGYLAAGDLAALLRHPAMSDTTGLDHAISARLKEVDAGAFRAEYPVALGAFAYYQVGASDLDALWLAGARARAALQLAGALNDRLAARLLGWAEHGGRSLGIKPTEREALRAAGRDRGQALAAIVARVEAAPPPPGELTRMLYALFAAGVATIAADHALGSARAVLPAAQGQLRLLPERVSGNPVALVDLLPMVRATEELIHDVPAGGQMVLTLQQDSEGLIAVLLALWAREMGATASPSASPTPAGGR